jgi:hypothetical protein
MVKMKQKMFHQRCILNTRSFKETATFTDFSAPTSSLMFKFAVLEGMGSQKLREKISLCVWFLTMIELSAEIEKHPPTCTYKHNAQFRPKKQRLARVSSF